MSESERDTDSMLAELPCVCAALRRATRLVTQLYDDEMRVAGVRATQFALLQTLKAAPGSTQSGIGEMLGIDNTTLSRTLKLLAKGKLITDTPGDDKRERHWRLTKTGQQRIDKAYQHWQSAQGRLQAKLSKSDWDLLIAIADKVARAAQRA